MMNGSGADALFHALGRQKVLLPLPLCLREREIHQEAPAPQWPFQKLRLSREGE